MLKRADKHVRTEWGSGVHTNSEGFNHNNHAIAHFGKQKVDGVIECSQWRDFPPVEATFVKLSAT